MNNKNVTTGAGIVFFDDEKGLQRCLEFHTGVLDGHAITNALKGTCIISAIGSRNQYQEYGILQN